MIRSALILLALALSACATTSTVRQQAPPSEGRTYALAFEHAGGDDLEGIGAMVRILRGRLLAAGMLDEGPTPGDRVEVRLTHYYVRSDATRLLVGILAGRDRIASDVTVFDATGTPVGRFEVETTNLSAVGSKEGLMERHADEIVARLRG